MDMMNELEAYNLDYIGGGLCGLVVCGIHKLYRVYRITDNRRLTDAWLLVGDSNYCIYGLNGYDE